MACRQDIRKKILDKVNEVFIEGRYTYYRVNDGTFRVANVRETRGKSRAKSLDQAKEIAIEVKDRIVAKYGNNVFVEVMLPQYVGFPVEIKVTPSELYVEKLFAKVLAEKRTEPISRLVFLQDPALYQQELMEDSPLKMIPYEAWLAQNKAPNPIVDENGQIKFFQKANVAETLNTLAKSPEKIENLKRTTEYSLLEQQDEDLGIKSGQAYMFLKEKDATRFSFLLEKHKQFPKEFTVTQKVTKYERDKADPLNFIGYNEYRDFLYVKSNNNKKSNLYNIIDTSTGELIAEKVRVLHLTKDAKEGIAKKYGLEFTPTEVFSPNRSIAFALYRQKPSKAKYIAQSKKYLYDALKFLNPEETGLKINLNQIETLLDAFPSGMWDYINTTYSPEDSTNINASISLQNKIKFKLPKLGLLTEIEKITGKKLQGVSFTNYDRSGGIQKVLGVDWEDTVTIDYKSMTTKQLRKAIAYYLSSTGYFKPSSEEENVRKYAEHTGVDYNKLRELVFGDFDKALDNIIYNQTGNSDTIELSKWRDSIRNYDWQMAELFSKPYEEFHKRAKEKVTEKFKDKKLSNGISHLDYFFSGNFNWLNINFNNISGQYYEEDMETQANVGVKKVVVGKINPFVMDVYKKPTPGKNFLKEQEVFNRLASILHEPFHALHALSYGTPEELELRKAFNNLYNTKFGKEMMNQVFGSGYRGEQISFDTLYKEFTAFATQLMLFPKEWIRKTDLRSNDIFEFIEKVQTLQDKTYEEIVRTKQKIGTTERIDTVEEKIKLTFLEKLYNFIASALNKVIPLSKKFFKTIADSKLVEKNIIEDVFGEVEETVTKVVKLPKDIEASKEEFLIKMDELKSAIMTLMQIDETMFSPKNIDNFFSQPAFYQETDLPTIKPGVEELFESNTELANIGTPEQYSSWINYLTTKGKLAGTKVTDILYHGSSQFGFDKFSKEKLGEFTGAGSAKLGFFFSNSLENSFSAYTGNVQKDVVFSDEGNIEGVEGTYGLRRINSILEDLDQGRPFVDFEVRDKTYFVKNTSKSGGISYGIPFKTKEEALEDYKNDDWNYDPDAKIEILENVNYGKYKYSKIDWVQDKPVVYYKEELGKKDSKITISEKEYNKALNKAKEILIKEKANYIKEESKNRVYNVLLDSKDLKEFDDKGNKWREDTYVNRIKQTLSENKDGLVIRNTYDPLLNDVYIVFEPEQIYILGGKEDIEGFRDFVNKPQQEIKEPTPDTRTIKPGVPELFESNPELANSVYEALGFETPTTELQGKKAIENRGEIPVNFDVIEELASGERSNLPSSILIKKLLEGGYLPKINETNIILGVTESGVWKPSLKRLEAYGRTESTLAKKIGHELLHSVTHNIITSYQNLKGVIDFNNKYYKDFIKQGYIKPVNLTKSQVEALDNLVRIRNKVVAYVEQNKDKIQKQDRGFGTYDYFIRTNYTEAETDLHEFISEVFTNPELINILKEIPTEGKKSNLFKDFVDAISKILGFTNTSILEDVIAYSEEAFFTQPQVTLQQKQQALQLYSQYLDTIFPNSQVKDIIYHGTDLSVDAINFKTDRGGIFLASTPTYASYFSKEENVYPMLVNFNNSYQAKQLTDNIDQEAIKQIKSRGFDSVIGKGGLSKMAQNQNVLEYIAFTPKQLYPLGTKQDLERFKQFAQTTPIIPTTTDITEIPDVMAAMIYQNNNCK